MHSAANFYLLFDGFDIKLGEINHFGHYNRDINFSYLFISVFYLEDHLAWLVDQFKQLRPENHLV